jgi:hypothetical protein
MTPDEYLSGFRQDFTDHNANTDRTLQKEDGVIGASDFVCRERMRRIIVQAPETDRPDKWAAHVGTAVDHYLKTVRKQQRPHLIMDARWQLTIDGRTFPVHPDEVDPSEPSVTDYKTNDGLAVARAGLMGDSARIQRHLQYLAGYKAGVLPAEGIVRNIVVDRSGKDPAHHVEQEPFDVGVVEQAAQMVRDVHYAIDNGEEASKDWPRPMCKRMCPFYTGCRGGELDESQPLDPDTAALVDAYGEAKALRNEAVQLMEELRVDLADVQGHTGTNTIHWKVKNGKTRTRSLHVDPIAS